MLQENNFSLPKTDRLIDSITSFDHLSSLDAHSEYHQILTHVKMMKKKQHSL